MLAILLFLNSTVVCLRFISLHTIILTKSLFYNKMPRIKSPPRKCVKSKNGEAKTWVLMMESNILSDPADDSENTTPDIVKLRHPRSGAGAMFLFSADNSIVQEVFSFSEKKRSWFINDSVREDGRMHLSTPVDPAFLILPYLKKSKEEGKVVPLDDLLTDSLFPETNRLLKCSALKNIDMLADRKGDADLNAWQYNEEKTMKWLSKKTERVAQVLKEKNIHIGGGAVSSNFVKSAKDDPVTIEPDVYLKYAHGLVSEYLTDDLSSKLLAALGLPEEILEDKSSSTKRKSSQDKVDNKRMKTETEVMDLSQIPKEKEKSNSEKPKLLSAKEKSMIKAASKTKPITSFFKRK